MRRGPGSRNHFYSEGVHQDYCFGPEKYYQSIHAQKNLQAANDWKMKWDDPIIKGMVVICFWRTINMQDPLRYRPLCFCDPATSSRSDVVDVALSGYRNCRRVTNPGTSTHKAKLVYNENQKWYFYPEMKPNEVMAFK